MAWDKYYFDVPSQPVRLDQTGCMYKPHVFGVRAGHNVEFVNSDSTGTQRARAPERQPGIQLQPADPAAEGHAVLHAAGGDGAVQVRHAQLDGAFAGVLDHPYFAVTTRAEIRAPEVPPGTYTLEAWQRSSARRPGR